MKTLGERLRLGLERSPQRSQAGLARFCDVSTATVSDWVNDHIHALKADNLRKAAQYLQCDRDWLGTGVGAPGWTDEQHSKEGARSRGAVAHILSEPAPTYLSLTWGEIMSMTKLPAEFVVSVPDDSMAPRVRTGDRVRFSTSVDARPGDGVLVRDGTGAMYFRQFRQRRPGSWQAHPLNDAYQPLDSDADQLTVVGVMVGIPEQRWG